MNQSIQQLEINSTGHYQILGGATVCMSFDISPGDYALITAAHTNFYKNQTWSMRFWVSEKPNGIAVGSVPVNIRSWISPLKMAQTIVYYDFQHAPPTGIDPPPVWTTPVVPYRTYYVNAKNMETRPNAFYLTVATAPIAQS